MELLLPMYNVHPYFSLKDLGKKVHIIHGQVRFIHGCFALSGPFRGQ